MIRNVRNVRALHVSFFLAAALTPVATFCATNGATLPVYPHSNHGGTARESVNEKYVNQAVANGDVVSLFTTDSPQTVDRWYAQKLPKSCVRHAITETSIQYACATRTVSITPSEGQTQIVLGPKP